LHHAREHQQGAEEKWSARAARTGPYRGGEREDDLGQEPSRDWPGEAGFVLLDRLGHERNEILPDVLRRLHAACSSLRTSLSYTGKIKRKCRFRKNPVPFPCLLAECLPVGFQNWFNPFLRLFLNVAEMCPDLHCAASGNAGKFRYGPTGAFSMRVLISRLVSRFLADQSGATAIEYCLIAAGISITIVAVVNGMGTQLNNKYTSVSTALK
jgi:pilus assembly protein Flp/PilA